MRNITLTQIRNLVNSGLATQISETSKLRPSLKIVGFSMGKYGITGILLESRKGELYAIIGKAGSDIGLYPTVYNY